MYIGTKWIIFEKGKKFDKAYETRFAYLLWRNNLKIKVFQEITSNLFPYVFKNLVTPKFARRVSKKLIKSSMLIGL